MRSMLFLILVALAAPAALAETAPGDAGIDHHVLISGADAPTGGESAVSLRSFEPGQRYEWDVRVEQDYETFEILLHDAVDVERVRQVVPTLHVEGVDYPLFHAFPNERIWEVDGPARVFHADGSPTAIRLRLGIPGPVEGTLTLQRDVEPPAFTLGPMTNLTHFSFYQEARTEELALADLQVREVGSDEWVQNPTVVYHYLQKFPVQGMDPDTTYEARAIFRDWAGNENVSDVWTFTTHSLPPVPLPSVTPVSPAPNATGAPEKLVIQARVEAIESPLADIRVFFDLKEIREDLVYENGTLSFTPPLLAPGLHTVSVEAINEAGGKSYAKWSFHVGEPQETPAPHPVLAIGLLGLVALASRRR